MLTDNSELRQRRLKSLLSRLRRGLLLFEEYDKVMKEQLASGVLESVSCDTPDVGMCYYLPHHCVIRNDHKTTRLRVVYDASSKIVWPSLNQSLYQGPSLLPLLVLALMRFREKRIVLT